MDARERLAALVGAVEKGLGGQRSADEFGQGYGRHERGLTAVELLTTLAIAAVLVTVAVPGFAALRRSAGVSTTTNELVWALHLARSSAGTRGQPATVCLSRDQQTCLPSPQDSASGWLVFHSEGQAVVPRAAPTGPLLHHFELPEGVTVRGTRPALTFWPTARAGSTGTFDVCVVGDRAAGRSVVVSQTGRPRIGTEAAQCDT